MEDFLDLEEIIILLIFEGVQQDVLKIRPSHLKDHLLQASKDRIGFILIKEVNVDNILSHLGRNNNHKLLRVIFVNLKSFLPNVCNL